MLCLTAVKGQARNQAHVLRELYVPYYIAYLEILILLNPRCVHLLSLYPNVANAMLKVANAGKIK